MSQPPAASGLLAARRDDRGRCLLLLGVIVLTVAAGLGFAACSLLSSFDEERLAENTYERCRDGTDNDGDGLTDCDDPDCAAFSICSELTPEACGDGIDNDNDGLIDCQDPGCLALPGVCTEQTPEACSDGIDNDGDGLIDCQDPDCQKLEICQEVTAAACSDGIDNDKDGLIDCNDFGCYSAPSCCTDSHALFPGDSFATGGTCAVIACDGPAPACCGSTYTSCCPESYLDCNPFAASRWVIWGLPRPRRESGAFVTNEPCGACSDVSGIVSAEPVRLGAGLELRFSLAAEAHLDMVCIGLTNAVVFPDTHQQCSGAQQPRLLVGICLETRLDSEKSPTASASASAASPPLPAGPDALTTDAGGAADAPTTDAGPASDAALLGDGLSTADARPPDQGAQADLPQDAAPDAGAGDAAPDAPSDGGGSWTLKTRVKLIVDGVVQEQKLVGLGPASVTGAIRFGVAPGADSIPSAPEARASPVNAPPLTVELSAATARQIVDIAGAGSQPALVLAYGHGSSGRLSDLKLSHPPRPGGRCPDPGAWYRHLARGEPVIGANPQPASAELAFAARPAVVAQPKGKGYFMLFDGKSQTTTGIFAATSPDGVDWRVGGETSNGSPQPVILAGAADKGSRPSSPALHFDAEAGLFRAWFSRRSESAATALDTIGHSSSKDGFSWDPAATDGSGGDALLPGPPGSWDDLAVSSPSVVLGPDGVFRMWYTGRGGEAPARPAIGLATSKDGLVWKRHDASAPALAPDAATADLGIEEAAVVYDASAKIYKMWYTYLAFGKNPEIRFAVSPDGVAWTRWAHSDVLTAGPLGTFDDRGVQAPAVLLAEKGIAKMWFTGIDGKGLLQIGYAENHGAL